MSYEILQFNSCEELIKYYNDLANRYRGDILTSLKLLTDKDFQDTFEINVNFNDIVDNLREIKDSLDVITDENVTNFINEIGNNLNGKVDRYYFSIDDYITIMRFDLAIIRKNQRLDVSFDIKSLILDRDLPFLYSIGTDSNDDRLIYWCDATDIFEGLPYIKSITHDNLAISEIISRLIFGMDEAYKEWERIKEKENEDE